MGNLGLDILRGRIEGVMTKNIYGKNLPEECWIDKNIEVVYEGRHHTIRLI